ncbi:MAG: Kazal-type serine protease inhibitor [Desulfobacterales bacterium]
MAHIDQAYAKAANRFRIAGPFTEHNFGVAQIDWGMKSSPQVTLKVVGEDGNTGFSQPIRLSELQDSQTMDEEQMIACKEPRLQLCTQDYRPVCTVRQDGSYKTYFNGCSACSDPAVSRYHEGTCE